MRTWIPRAVCLLALATAFLVAPPEATAAGSSTVTGHVTGRWSLSGAHVALTTTSNPAEVVATSTVNGTAFTLTAPAGTYYVHFTLADVIEPGFLLDDQTGQPKAVTVIDAAAVDVGAYEPVWRTRIQTFSMYSDGVLPTPQPAARAGLPVEPMYLPVGDALELYRVDEAAFTDAHTAPPTADGCRTETTTGVPIGEKVADLTVVADEIPTFSTPSTGTYYLYLRHPATAHARLTCSDVFQLTTRLTSTKVHLGAGFTNPNSYTALVQVGSRVNLAAYAYGYDNGTSTNVPGELRLYRGNRLLATGSHPAFEAPFAQARDWDPAVAVKARWRARQVGKYTFTADYLGDPACCAAATSNIFNVSVVKLTSRFVNVTAPTDGIVRGHRARFSILLNEPKYTAGGRLDLVSGGRVVASTRAGDGRFTLPLTARQTFRLPAGTFLMELRYNGNESSTPITREIRVRVR